LNKLIYCVLVTLLLSVHPVGYAKEQENLTQRTYVLVHGAWVGEWAWEPVARILRDHGHKVYNVSLKGQGKRRDEHNGDITLEDHINDVLTVLEENDLKRVYLVPHSYGGKVATGAWDRARDRIHHVIYVDAFAPVREGEDAFIQSNNVTNFLASNPDATASSLLPFPDPSAPIAARTVGMPIGTIGATFGLEEPLPETTLRSYVLAGNYKDSVFSRRYYPIIEQDERWIKYVLPTRHQVMMEMPEVLSAILLNAK